MMLCPKCGASLQENSRFCSACGVPLNSIDSETSAGLDLRPHVEGQEGGQTEGAPLNDQDAPVTPRQTVTPADVPMKWFKFIINFQLILSALSFLIDGLNLMTGAYYGVEDASYLFAYYPGLKAFSSVAGLLSLALAVFAVYTRFRLAHFRANGPTLYYLYDLLQLGLDFILWVSLSSITRMQIPFKWTNVVIPLSALLINYVYFTKRSFLFIN